MAAKSKAASRKTRKPAAQALASDRTKKVSTKAKQRSALKAGAGAEASEISVAPKPKPKLKSKPKSIVIDRAALAAAPMSEARDVARVAPLDLTDGERAKTTEDAKPIEAPETWVELFPSGISVQSGVGRPVLILKDKDGVEVLPVWMNPLDAGVALAELSDGSGLTPHAVTRRVLSALDLKLESCVFTELIGHHQFVLLKFVTQVNGMNAAVGPLRLRADEAMSFCLQAKARFFGTRSYMARCRDLDAELGQLEQGLSSGILANLQAEMEISSKKHPYVL